MLNIWCNQSQIGNSLTTYIISLPIMWYAIWFKYMYLIFFGTFLIYYKSNIFRCIRIYSIYIFPIDNIRKQRKADGLNSLQTRRPCTKMPGGFQLAKKFARWGRNFLNINKKFVVLCRTNIVGINTKNFTIKMNVKRVQ